MKNLSNEDSARLHMRALKFLESPAYKTLAESKLTYKSSAAITYISDYIGNISDEGLDLLNSDVGKKYIEHYLSSYRSTASDWFSTRRLEALKQEGFISFTDIDGKGYIYSYMALYNDAKFAQLVEGLKQKNFRDFIGNIHSYILQDMAQFSDEKFAKLVTVICDPRFIFPPDFNPDSIYSVQKLLDIDFNEIDKFLAHPKTGGEWIRSKADISKKPYQDSLSSEIPLLSTEQSVIDSIFRYRVNGPWAAPEIDNARMKKVMNMVVRNTALNPIFDIVALRHYNNKNIANFYQQPFFLTEYFDGFVGWADYNNTIHMPLYATVEGQVETTAHELGHASIGAIFRNHMNPYNYGKEDRDNFDEVMRKSITNLHKRFLPDITPPHNITELLKSLDSNYVANARSQKLISKDLRNVIDVITMIITNYEDNSHHSTLKYTKEFLGSLTVLTTHYTKDKYHVEFVVKLPEALMRFGSLPPHIMDDMQPLVNDYKTRIIPTAHNFTDSHPYKDGLIQDAIKPETPLSLSGEDELMTKKVLTEEELKLVAQIETAQKAVKDGNHQELIRVLDGAEEMVVRAALKSSIECDQPEMFDAILPKIKATQFLGPQLLIAAELNKTAMAMRLMPAIDDQYYLARTAEIAVTTNNLDLLQSSISRVDHPWFMVSAADKAIELNRTRAFVEAAERAEKPQMNDLLLSELIAKKNFADIDSMVKDKYLNFDHVCKVMAGTHLESRQIAAHQYWGIPTKLNPLSTTTLTSGCAAYDAVNDPYLPALIIGTTVIGALLWKAIKGIDSFLRPKPLSYVEAVSASKNISASPQI